MELIDLSLIKPMLMRSLENPEAIKVFVNNIIFGGFMGTPIVIIMTTIIVSFLYKTIHDTIKGGNDENKENKEDKEEVKSSTKFWKICFNNLKYYLQKYRYFFIGGILLALCRMIVSLLYRCISLQMTGVNIPMDKFTSKEIMVLNHRIAYVLLFFIIAPIFIMVSFGNKFVRNIGIFIYILGILFILLGDFIQLGYMGM